MIKIFFLSILLSISHSIIQASSPAIACISLGKLCSSALNFKRHNLSKAYYPFDFMETPFDSLCMLLNNKFKNFIDKKLLIVTRPSHSWENPNTLDRTAMSVVENQITKCIFYHDFKGSEADHGLKAVASRLN
ncbi:hypothetical protein FJ365_03725 [Candidatus Dependentiae bacterium]|nr:hypothetical protein [Candidatus Dependentiae bacterium]